MLLIPRHDPDRKVPLWKLRARERLFERSSELGLKSYCGPSVVAATLLRQLPTIKPHEARRLRSHVHGVLSVFVAGLEVCGRDARESKPDSRKAKSATSHAYKYYVAYRLMAGERERRTAAKAAVAKRK